ncbi:Translation initiation factor eIF-2B subunit delta [Rhynchospora pubera]|uniref:Translation initiation factor eIF2B subunit delta n=1 Tax=Rhynchospora pubera TaxID=906938 RepID=A0AAV8EJY1_9POAL|nr:Translation initiation factor eIF-2B subunit delta [Rhynchospora pubera]
MDLRRPNRPVIGPKVRQVGFVTPDSAAATSSSSIPAVSAAAATSAGSPPSSLSPVMIPPPRHPSTEMSNPHFHPVGSYNPSEQILGSPPALSPSRSSRFDADGSDFGGDDDESVALSGVGGGMTPKSSLLMRQPVTKTAPLVSETHKRDSNVSKGKGDGPSAAPKEKLTKAERRATQEAQRAAKAAAKEAAAAGGAPSVSKQPKPATKPATQQKKDVPSGSGPLQPLAPSGSIEKKQGKKEVAAPHPRMQFDDMTKVGKLKKRAVVNQSEARNRVELFRHLPQYEHGTQLPDLELKFFQLDLIHPSVYQVGLQFLSDKISGGNARCIAMLLAFKEVIQDYTTPPEKTLTRDLGAKVGSCVSFLIECRPLSVSMGNAIRFLKNRISSLPHNLSDKEAKSRLQSDIDRFINEKIIIASKAIVEHGVSKIRDGDVLLTYGSPSVVESIFAYAHGIKKNFRVVVVDSRPKHEGQGLLRRLVERGIHCTYTHLNAVSYVMHEVTRVFLGASSVLSNGTVYSRVGTACVAMVAHAFRVPVLVCCEAYKFHERVQLDSICSNELGDPDAISKVSGRKNLNYLDGWAQNENIQLLNLKYDATPSDYVSVLVTEQGMLPPTSVPVIIREYGIERLWT